MHVKFKLPDIPPDVNVWVTDRMIHDARIGRLFGLGIKTLQTSSASLRFFTTAVLSGFSFFTENCFSPAQIFFK